MQGKDRLPRGERYGAAPDARQEGERKTTISAWARLVLLSALLLAGAALALIAWDVGSSRERLVSYPVTGAVDGVAFDIGDAGIVVVGGGRRPAVDVQRRERFSFGHVPETRRAVAGGVLRVRSRCPASLPSSCSVRYRVVVPDNVPVEIRTDGGAVEFRDYRGSARVSTRSGDIDVAGFCGFSLQARAESGNVHANASCPPQQLSLRATTGSVHAIVPSGRYRVDAQSAAGEQSIRGVTETPDAPFAIQALSGSGDVLVERGS